MTANWRTTTAGALAIIAALSSVAAGLIGGRPIDWACVSGIITTGIGLLFARDGTR